MFALFRAPIVCLVFFLVLSITINGKTIFQHIYSVTSHVTVPVQNLTVGLVSKATDSTTQYTKKLFDNSVPKLKDSIRTKASAPQRKANNQEPAEFIDEDEKQELDSLIRNYRE